MARRTRKMLSTTAVARLLGVAVGSVSNWIDQGNLKAGRTPGGHRRVEAGNLVEFLRKQNLPVPSELVSGNPKILIVDDEESARKWLAEEFRAACPQVEVLAAEDGFVAGEIVGSQRPDVVILDLRMPGMDGFEVCRRIKSKKETRDTAVVAITAYMSPQAEEKILQCGAKACLGKPLDFDVLLKHVSEALGVAFGSQGANR